MERQEDQREEDEMKEVKSSDVRRGLQTKEAIVL